MSQKIISPGKQPFRVYYFSIDLPVVLEGAIVDIETRGLEPHESNLTALGHIKWNKLSAFVIHEEDEEKYQNEFREWVKDKVSRLPRPLIAYNKEFEEKWLDIKFDRDIQPIRYQAKDRDIDNYYGFKPRAIEIAHLGEVIHGEEMLDAKPEDIMKHLVQDLYSELALYASLAHLIRWRKEILPGEVDPWSNIGKKAYCMNPDCEVTFKIEFFKNEQFLKIKGKGLTMRCPVCGEEKVNVEAN